MNTRTGILTMVAFSFLLVLGVELWTLSEMIWKGFRGDEEPSRSKPAKDLSSFRLGSLEGRFKDLQISVSGSNWTFRGKANFEETGADTRTMVVSHVKLDSGDTVSINRSATLSPDKSTSVSFETSLSPGTQPMQLTFRGRTVGQQWTVKLPTVTARSE